VGPAPEGSSEPPALRALEEGRRFESYVEQHTRDMHTCFLCERVAYRKIPVKKIGGKWLCIDCLRELKEGLDSLEHWEHLVSLPSDLERATRAKRASGP
jgi:ribosomal protein L37AE/L43A